jgi:TRAP-type mannitol/chloroaromatic compound transport system substrate-binding protein
MQHPLPRSCLQTISIIIFLLMLLPLPSLAAQKVALVIGNSQYKADPLPNPVNDATDMAGVLETLGFEVILEKDADKNAMVGALRTFHKKLGAADIGLFYYAGHGMQISGNNYLIPVRHAIAEEFEVESEAIAANRILSAMESAGNPLNIVILDACRNNPFQSFRGAQKGLAEMKAPRGTIISYATSPGSLAEDGRGRNGTYTEALLKNFQVPGLDLQKIFNRTGLDVMEKTGGRQMPWVSSTPLPDFYLAGGAPEDRYLPPEQPQTAQPQQVDQQPVPPAQAPAQPQAPASTSEAPQKARLYVVTDPGGGRVRIMNIVEKYHDGIELDFARYKLEGSLEGYQTKTQWISIDRPGDVDVTLTLTPEPAAPAQTAPRKEPKPAPELPASRPASASQKFSSLGKDVRFKWQPSSWLTSGITWDTINVISKRVTQNSNGHLVMTPSSPGSIVPVSEQLSAVGRGIMKATFIWPGYFPGELPVAYMHGDCFAAPKTIGELRYLYETYEDGRIMKLLREEYAKHGVHLVGNMYWILDNLMISKKPINGVDDIKGMKFRTSELIALQLADLGAGTIWVPGDEIYTMLSTGAVDAITFSHAADMVDMGFHEVTKYWIKYPTAVGPAADAFIVNLKEWNKLPYELKAIVESEVEAGTTRNQYEGERKIGEAWEYVQRNGIEIIEWSENDAKILASKAREVVPWKFLKDPAFAEIFSIVDKWAVEMGYWAEK